MELVKSSPQKTNRSPLTKEDKPRLYILKVGRTRFRLYEKIIASDECITTSRKANRVHDVVAKKDKSRS
jgi:hypothetical protein